MAKQALNLINKTFNPDQITSLVGGLRIEKKSNRVLTHLNNDLISSSKCSSKYGVLDFSALVHDKLDVISNVLQPESFDLYINGGIQQLRLYTPKFKVRDDYYQKMLVLFNSSNGYHPFILDAGLFREVCSNGMMANTRGNEFQLKSRHYKEALARQIEKIDEQLELMETSIQNQIKFIHDVSDSKVSLKKIVTMLLKKNNYEIKKTALPVINKFGQKLLFSETDALQIKLSSEQINALNNPLKLANGESDQEDVLVPGMNVYNCYTEIFRNRHHAIQERESRRVSTILSS